jgi:hypothetical protein
MSDIMANNYSVSEKTWKWTKRKLFFHLIDLTILYAFINQCSCADTLSHKLFHEWLVSGLIHTALDTNPAPSTSGHGRPSSQAIGVSRLDFKYSHLGDVICVPVNVSRLFYYCEGCNVGLCVYPCSKLFHTMLHYSECLQKNQLYFLWHIFTCSICSGELISWDNPVPLSTGLW